MSLSTTIKNVFTFSLDAVDRRFEAQDSLDRLDFWNHIYEEREGERLEFDSFLRRHTEILLVSGHVGSGKSTYLRHKLESKPYNTYGLIIDIQRYASEFDAVEEIGTGEHPKLLGANVFQEIIVKEFRRRIRENIMYYLERRIPISVDIAHRLDFHQPRESSVPWDSRDLKNQADERMSTAALMYIDNDGLDELRASLGCVGDDDALLKCFRFALQDGLTTREVLSRLQWHDWPDLYRKVLRVPTLPLLIFDNLDHLPTSVLPNIVRILVDVANRINRASDLALATAHSLPHFKLVAAIRDENISHIRLQAGASQRLMHIALGNRDRMLDVSTKRRLGISPFFVQRVIERRLKVVHTRTKSNPALELFGAIIRVFWFAFKDDRPDLLDTVGGIGLLRLNNESLRLILEMISESTLSVLDQCIDRGITSEFLSSGNPRFALKGLFVQSLPEVSTLSRIFECIQGDLERELRGDYCGVHRVILTYLSNVYRPGETGESYKQLATRLTSVFGYEESRDINSGLIELYQSASRQGELITIDQNDFPTDATQIDSTSEIRLSGRGESLIDNILINIDFFGLLSKQTDGGLFTLSPLRAARYVDTILHQWIQPLVKCHTSFWANTVAPSLCSDEEIPFRHYTQHYTYGEEFYMSRVIDSHRAAIKRYIIEASLGLHGRLLLAEDDLSGLLSLIDSLEFDLNLTKDSFDEEVESFIEILPEGQALTELWKAYHQYGAERAKLRTYQSLRLRQVRDLQSKEAPKASDD